DRIAHARGDAEAPGARGPVEVDDDEAVSRSPAWDVVHGETRRLDSLNDGLTSAREWIAARPSSPRGHAIVGAVPLDEAGDPLLDRGFRPEAEVARQVVDVGPRRGDIARLEVQEVLLRAAAQAFLEHLDVPQQLDGPIVANVVNAIGGPTGPRVGSITGPFGIRRGGLGQNPHDPLDDVVDVGEVPLHPALVEDVDGLAVEDRLREEEE